ncbi:MAG: tetratricopeptide repeat-containing sensor histidine kinase [Cyclobacteriaceae bacterium]
MRLFFIFFLSIVSLGASAQAESDSLWQIWTNPDIADSGRIGALQDFIQLNTEPSKPYAELADEAYELAEKNGSEDLIIKALIVQGDVQHKLENYDRAIQLYSESIELSKELAWRLGVGHALLRTGETLYRLSDNDQAMKAFSKGYALFDLMEDQTNKAIILHEIGKIHLDQGRRQQAMESFLGALNINETLGNKSDIIDNYIGLGVLYVYLEDYEPALEYYNRGYDLSEELGQENTMSTILNNMGIIYDNRGDFERALEYYSRSLALAEKIGDKTKIAIRYTNLGTLYETFGDYEKSQEFQLKSLDLNEEIGRKKGATINLVNLGNLSRVIAERAVANNNKTLATTKYKEAIDFGNRAQELLKETNIAQEVLSSYLLLYRAHKGLGNTALALKNHEQYAAKKDSLSSAKYNNDIVRLDIKHASEKQAAIDSILVAEETFKLNVKLKQERTENLILYLGVLFLLIFAAAMYYFYRILLARKNTIEVTLNKLEKTQDQLLQSRKMAALGVLATGIAHQINNPLNFINGSSELISRKIEENYPKDIEVMDPFFHSIREGVDRISKIIKSLNSFGKTTQELNALCDTQDIIKDCLVMLYQELDKRIEVNESYQARGIIRGNPSGLHQVFLNVLMNACQSIKEKGTISILMEQKEDTLSIVIKDDGEGIAEENLTKITDPFFSTKTDINGIGLGLFIAYSTIEEHNGTLSFESELGKGTTAIISLPVEKGL